MKSLLLSTLVLFAAAAANAQILVFPADFSTTVDMVGSTQLKVSFPDESYVIQDRLASSYTIRRDSLYTSELPCNSDIGQWYVQPAYWTLNAQYGQGESFDGLVGTSGFYRNCGAGYTSYKSSIAQYIAEYILFYDIFINCESYVGPSTITHNGATWYHCSDTYHVTYTGGSVDIDLNVYEVADLSQLYRTTILPYYGNVYAGVIAANSCLADMNCDGYADGADYTAFIAAFGSDDPSADLNGDFIVDADDYTAFINSYSAGC